MRLTIFAVLVVMSTEALASERMFAITNLTGHTVSGLTATDKLDPALAITATLEEGGIVHGNAGDVEIALGSENCVVDLTFTLSSGATLVQQNIDVCNTDGIILE